MGVHYHRWLAYCCNRNFLLSTISVVGSSLLPPLYPGLDWSSPIHLLWNTNAGGLRRLPSHPVDYTSGFGLSHEPGCGQTNEVDGVWPTLLRGVAGLICDMVGFLEKDQPSSRCQLKRHALVPLTLLLAIIGSGRAQAQECNDCDCYHFPIPQRCEKCCMFASGTISSVTETSLVLSTTTPTGKKASKSFEIGPTVENKNSLKRGAEATVFYHAAKEPVATHIDVLDQLQGLLIPGSEPDPPDPCPVGMVPPGSLRMFLGKSLGSSNSPNFVVLRLNGEDVLMARRVEKGMAVSAKILSEDGRIVAQLVDNKFYINPENFFSMERPDQHSLIVYDRQGQKVLDLRFLNPTSVSILGVFRHPGALPVVINQDVLMIGGNRFIGICFAGAEIGISVN